MNFRKIYNEAILYPEGHIEIDGKGYPCTIGKHCVWIPELEIKIPWTFNGKIECIDAWKRGRNKEALENQYFNDGNGWDEETLISIQNEYAIFDKLSEYDMAPSVYGYVYFKVMIAQYIRGEVHADSMGAIGFYIRDANKLEPGGYSYNRFITYFIDTEEIECSEGALGDLQKEGNVVNGYLIDIRRTIWDMMKLKNSSTYRLNISHEINDSDEKIKAKVLKYGQFPYEERKTAYQTYWFKDHYEEGTRKTLYRFDKMGIEKSLEGKTVLDLGCQIGSICTECYRRCARWITGIDYQREYIDCARDLARVNHMQINYLQMDLTEIKKVVEYIKRYYPEGVDIIFALSLWKHIKEHIFFVLKNMSFGVAYIESNNCPDGFNGSQAWDIEAVMNKYFNFTRIGMTDDRSPRCLWRIGNA